MADRSNGKELADRTAAVRYLATMTADLAAIARGHGLDVLSYLLDMARVEAENVSRPPDDLD